MKIFIVNLERAADRRAAILRHLAELGLEAEILPAVEGVKVDRATLGPGAEPGLSNGEVGCYLSHLRFWQLVVERRLPHAIVLEDDVVCSPSLLRVARDAAALILLIKATTSCGISEFPSHGATEEKVLAAADIALYAAKERGRNQVVIWTEISTRCPLSYEIHTQRTTLV